MFALGRRDLKPRLQPRMNVRAVIRFALINPAGEGLFRAVTRHDLEQGLFLARQASPSALRPAKATSSAQTRPDYR